MIQVRQRIIMKNQALFSSEDKSKQEMLQYVTNAPEGPLCTTHLLIMLYLSVMFP